MRYDHLGELRDMDPKLASFELKIIRALRGNGPTKSADLWYRTGAQRVGREVFNAALTELVERKIIHCEPTHRVNRVIYRMAPDQRRRERAEKRQEAAVKPLTPETA